MNSKVLSVSDVNQYIKTLLESNSLLKNLLIQGELSNVRKSAAGHLYFSLKDSQSKLDCVMFRNAVKNLKFLPQEGHQVTVRGAIGIYLPSGQYQMTVRSMEPRGKGDLYQAFLMLKDELKEKGYFDQEHKRSSGHYRPGWSGYFSHWRRASGYDYHYKTAKPLDGYHSLSQSGSGSRSV